MLAKSLDECISVFTWAASMQPVMDDHCVCPFGWAPDATSYEIGHPDTDYVTKSRQSMLENPILVIQCREAILDNPFSRTYS